MVVGRLVEDGVVDLVVVLLEEVVVLSKAVVRNVVVATVDVVGGPVRPIFNPNSSQSFQARLDVLRFQPPTIYGHCVL